MKQSVSGNDSMFCCAQFVTGYQHCVKNLICYIANILTLRHPYHFLIKFLLMFINDRYNWNGSRRN